jgi:hypothetical protein
MHVQFLFEDLMRTDHLGDLDIGEIILLSKVVPVLPLTEHHAMKAYWGSVGTAPPIL